MNSLCILLAGLTLDHAQSPAETLNGKTIHVIVDVGADADLYFNNDSLPMTRVSDNQFAITVNDPSPLLVDFYFHTNWTSPKAENYKWKLSRVGLTETSIDHFHVSDFQGQSELWVFVDPAGPIKAPPVLSLKRPKVVHVLNPWPASAPQVQMGNGKFGMFVTKGLCGWFSKHILDSMGVKGRFVQIGGDESYGAGGLASTADFDFPGLFAGKGDTLWLNTRTNAWTASYPAVDGECRMSLEVTVHDVSAGHPDFSFASLNGDHSIQGMVHPNLGANRKPVSTQRTQDPVVTYGRFDSWWVTDTTATDSSLRNYPGCSEIPLKKTADGGWRFDSYWDSMEDRGFFPTEDMEDRFSLEKATACANVPNTTSWVTGLAKRNFNFCVETHATFDYHRGQKLKLRGDDDIWIYIDGKLVVDLGGVHTPKQDSLEVENLGLIEGEEYAFDMFQCDRQQCASTLDFSTNIPFKQQKLLDWVPGSAPIGILKFTFMKRVGSQDDCVILGDSALLVSPSNPRFELKQAVNGTLVKIQNLTEGSAFDGGILISGSTVTLDTAKLRSAKLDPGSYRIAAYESANIGPTALLSFEVIGAVTSIRSIAVPRVSRQRPKSFPNALGRKLQEKRAFLIQKPYQQALR